MTEPGFICRTCGQEHSDSPFSFAADFPDAYVGIPESERGNRTLVSSDQCIIDDNQFYVRGCLEIPIIGTKDIFLWGIWALVKEDVFNEISECWDEGGRETRHGPFKARLGNSLSTYPETMNLKMRVDLQPVGARPLLVVEEEHPLAGAQQNGISLDEAITLASTLLHISAGSKSIQ